ncbi:MAG TPA: carboxypeptidase-like regulatory domain-containing protein [Pyrinomonadaceae bacterium]|nr:carboxypeptidase-like regulatory domain-containing protein [Pyrinomonadaceae bacterium]
MYRKFVFYPFIYCTLLFVFCVEIFGQSGGSFQITQSVMASGGDSSSGGTFSLSGTIGQTVSGSHDFSGTFSLISGFWTPPNLIPSAANVSISGRVLNKSGQGVRNAILTLMDSSGAIRSTRSTAFGFYSFEEVPAGASYVLTISSKRFVFQNPTRILTLSASVSDVDFTTESDGN